MLKIQEYDPWRSGNRIFPCQQTMFFSIPLLVVALGGMFSERSGVVNIALEGIMIMGAFVSILFVFFTQDIIKGQLLLILAVLVAGASGPCFRCYMPMPPST
jgi:simple sugar transport system permease protein